ncbi:uncharacterized protein LOC129222852 [Uloborus diversus]|uniref:uncharacterized protein LOC129222852 n=1 Tax=Uloborus diversus TaxID=327109 RepID=UPI00240A1A81|nr:uncharacterized protein LOC129222852 [Uloborus diversus]
MDTAESSERTLLVNRLSDSDDSLKNEKKGLSVGLASVFIVGEMAGSGVLALPKALAEAGWGGLVLLFVICINTLYSVICLGRCWSILEERYEEYQDIKFRYPYPAIAYRAVGPKMRYIVSVCLQVTLMGVATVFLLLSSQLISSLASKLGVDFCFWILILAVILCPLMWLGTPDDFWPAAVVALVTTVSACILIVVDISMEQSASTSHKSPDIASFFLSYGTILFSFGGASTFPTFQNDMKDSKQFSKAAIAGFSVLLLLYVPVAVMGYKAYGDTLDTNVILSLPESSVKVVIEILMALHLFFAFLLVINSPAQELEECLKIPNSFGWQRIVLRTVMMLVIIFIGQSMPHFGKLLNLIGGSTTAFTTSVFPCFFYLKLCSQEYTGWNKRTIPLWEKVYLIAVILFGLIGGSISTYSAIMDIIKADSFTPPCYVNITAASRH